MQEFKAVGISYHNASLEVRESVSLNETEAREFLMHLKETLDIEEALAVSTCNRTEVYYSASKDRSKEIISLLAINRGIEQGSVASHFRSYSSEEAIGHLFEVSLGLDSQVLGDIQISNQVKRAYQTSADLEMAGPFLHRLMHTIFFANKRVVQETRLQDGNASVASVAVELIKGFTESISEPRIALIGLGEIGQNVLENLKELQLPICLVNRTKSRAEKFAAPENISVESLANLPAVIEQNDVIISAISANEELIHATDFNKQPHHKLLIDLSVPRSIAEDVKDVPGIALYNVDQLSSKTKKAQQRREQSVPDAKRIVTESIGGFNEWKEEMEVSPTIQKLKNALDQIRKDELARHSSKVSSEEMELLEVVTKSMIQKVIKLPVLQLKAACKRGESETLVEVLNDLFDLESDKVKKG